ncbi:SGF29 tudor-like domain-containing protein, partial [Chytridium lagenaria]
MSEMAEELWPSIYQNIQNLDDVKKVMDPTLTKINKIHNKVVKAEKFTVKVARKLQEVYTEVLNQTAIELKIIEKFKENANLLAALLDAGNESKRKKRKLEDKAKPNKKSRITREDIPEVYAPLPPGSQVAVRPLGHDHILAVIVKWLPDKLKYEVEDAEDDEENPGTRKRYVFPAKLVIPIPEVPHKPEFPVNHIVLALYPNSSCFYKANVVKPPSKNQDEEAPGFYVVRFDDDNGFERYVDPTFVLDMPKGGPKISKS